MKKRLFFVLATLAISTASFAQSIFSYGGEQVNTQEFLRMYTKNAISKKPSMQADSLKAYITLYSRFKMKVKEAEAAKIDTLPTIVQELDTYKKQLSKNYLTDKNETERLAQEAHTRLKKDLRVAHIMISIPRGAQDTSAAYRQVDSIYNLLNNGADFATLAKQISADKSNSDKGGELGYISALQTPYEFENAMYTTAIGKISKPFRSPFGYHVVKVLAERPSRGELQVSQILLEVKKSSGEKGKEEAKKKADSIYTVITTNKAKWDDMVLAFSQDKFSVNNKGELPIFGVGAMITPFEEAAYALTKVGEISKPIFTDYGYHLIKLLRKIPTRPFDSVKIEITKKVERDSRMDYARQVFLNKLKTKGNFIEEPSSLNFFIQGIPDTCIKNGALVIEESAIPYFNLFKLGGKNYTTKDYMKFFMSANRGRMYGEKRTTFNAIYKSYVESSLIEFEEKNIETENKEYASLIKEYRDGIILFELTDKTVWTRASTDTAGLSTFYNLNKSKFNWGPSFEGKIVKSGNPENIQEFYTLLQNNTPVDTALNELIAKVVYEEGKFEYDKHPAAVKQIAEGKYSTIIKNTDGTNSVYIIEKINNNNTPKTLQEARGFVIADYQEYLEKEWISSMEAKYPVKINDAELKKIAKNK
jgi:peptidyl-prolyl cis-trans isomerase SurA